MTKQRRDSAIKRWVESGGDISALYIERQQQLEIYPHIDKKTPSDFDFGMFGSVIGLLACIAGLFFVFSKFLGGPPVEPVESLLDIQPTETVESAEYVLLSSTQMPVLPVLSEGYNGIRPPVEDLPDTPMPTPTPIFTPTLTPSPTPMPGIPQSQRVRLGWFYPPLGGSHCPSDIECESLPLADRQGWLFRLGAVAACPEEYPLGSFVEVSGVWSGYCAHRLPIVKCNYASLVCDVLVLSAAGSVVEDWKQVYDATLYLR